MLILQNKLTTKLCLLLPRIVNTCPFQYNFEVEDLSMVERFVYVPLNRWSIAKILLHVMPIDLSANEG